jgi:hypothetical protein
VRLRNRKGRRSALIIPDAHATPDYCNTRFDWLGRFAHDLDPDYVICLGDWYDFPSLSRHDPLGSRTMEGVRYTDDLRAGDEALDRFHHYYRRKGRSRQIVTLGNHDVRPDIAAAAQPNFFGAIGCHDLTFADHGWEITPYRRSITVEGIVISHHQSAGISGRPIGGQNMASALVKQKHVSCIVGHSHILQHSEHTRADGQKIFGLSGGCYGHHDYAQDACPRAVWARDTAEMWWRGVIVIGDLDGAGYYDDIRFVTQRWMRRNYSG